MLELIRAQPAPWRAAVEAAIAAPVVRMGLCLHLDFADGPLALSNRAVPFTDLQHGRVYGAGRNLLIGLPDLSGQDGTLAPWREYKLGFATSAMLADPSLENWMEGLIAFCGNTANYRTRMAELGLQLFDAAGFCIGWPIVLDRGLMDRMSLAVAPDGIVVTLQVESLLSRKGVPPYGMWTYRNQAQRYPGDLGCQFVTEAGQRIVWTEW